MSKHEFCPWHEEEDPSGAIYYVTECENAFQFTEGGVEENHFEYCPYCGGAIIYVEYLDEN